jgi:hypothetical protein
MIRFPVKARERRDIYGTDTVETLEGIGCLAPRDGQPVE